MRRLSIRSFALCAIVALSSFVYASNSVPRENANVIDSSADLNRDGAPAIDAAPVVSAVSAAQRTPGSVQTNLMETDCTIPSGCEAWPTDPTSGGAIPGTTLCTSDYCWRCGMDGTLTKSLCYRQFVQGAAYCECQNTNYVGTDKAGNKYALCKTSGSCAYKR